MTVLVEEGVVGASNEIAQPIENDEIKGRVLFRR